MQFKKYWSLLLLSIIDSIVITYIGAGLMVVALLSGDSSLANVIYFVIPILVLSYILIAHWYAKTGKLNFYIAFGYLLVPPFIYAAFVALLYLLR